MGDREFNSLLIPDLKAKISLPVGSRPNLNQHPSDFDRELQHFFRSTFYIYKEMQKTKLDVQKLNDAPDPTIVSFPPVSVPIKSILKKKTAPEPEIVADEST